MFDQILLPLDRSPLAECVLPHAIALAHTFESQVTVLHVMDTPRDARWRRAMDPLNWQIRKAEAKMYLQDMKFRLQAAGLITDTQLLEGFAAEQILGFADTYAPHLIVLSSHGQSGLSEWGVSSVVHKIAQRAHTSVMIVRAAQPVAKDATDFRYRRILVPMDGTPRAEYVLPAASALARAHEAQIVLVHIVQRPPIPRRTPPSREDLELADQVVERNQAEANQYLDQLRSRLTGNVEVRVLVSDHLTTTLHELVKQDEFDLMLLSAPGDVAHTRGLDGDVISSMLAYGTAPLMIMQDSSHSPIVPISAEVANSEPGRQ